MFDVSIDQKIILGIINFSVIYAISWFTEKRSRRL